MPQSDIPPWARGDDVEAGFKNSDHEFEVRVGRMPEPRILPRMKKYKVTLDNPAFGRATALIEASSRREAWRKAKELYEPRDMVQKVVHVRNDR